MKKTIKVNMHEGYILFKVQVLIVGWPDELIKNLKINYFFIDVGEKLIF